MSGGPSADAYKDEVSFLGVGFRFSSHICHVDSANATILHPYCMCYLEARLRELTKGMAFKMYTLLSLLVRDVALSICRARLQRQRNKHRR